MNFFEFSKKFLVQIVSMVFKVTKKTVFTEFALLMWPRKIIENDPNFCRIFRIFRFLAEISNFLVRKFFYRFYTSKPSFMRKISFLPWKPDFISIFIDFGQKLPILGDPPYFEPHVLTPLWSRPIPKKLHMVRKG